LLGLFFVTTIWMELSSFAIKCNICLFYIFNTIKPLGAKMIQVDIGGHPPFPTGSKQFYDNFGNLLFLAVITLGAILRA
jgi:hypothetical protein